LRLSRRVFAHDDFVHSLGRQPNLAACLAWLLLWSGYLPEDRLYDEGCYIETGRIATMAIGNLLSEIDAEIGRLEQVRALLSGTASLAAKKRGRPAGVAPATKPAKRVMSAESRERIAAAQRKRWAKQKKAAATAKK
jgi:hypothetical protein